MSLGRLVRVVRLHARHCAVHWACSGSDILVIFSLWQCSVILESVRNLTVLILTSVVQLSAWPQRFMSTRILRGRLEVNLHSIVDTTNFS